MYLIHVLRAKVWFRPILPHKSWRFVSSYELWTLVPSIDFQWVSGQVILAALFSLWNHLRVFLAACLGSSSWNVHPRFITVGVVLLGWYAGPNLAIFVLQKYSSSHLCDFWVPASSSTTVSAQRSNQCNMYEEPSSHLDLQFYNQSNTWMQALLWHSFGVYLSHM